MLGKSFIGPIIHCSNKGKLVIHEKAQIHIKDGKIEKINLNPETFNVDQYTSHLKNGEFLIPGFVDAHIHAVQMPNLGLGYDKSLLDWLDAYTFPLEKEYKDEKFAQKVFKAVVKRTLKMGTTTACYFASLYRAASLILAETAAAYGQRALIGKVNMSVGRPDDYRECLEDSIKETIQFIEDIEKIDSPLIKPIITPRFAISCDMKLMKMLGDLAREKDIHVQTHISENKEEIKIVEDLFPESPSYAAVYEAAGLLTNKTVLAHGIYLTDNELTLLNKNKSAVIHCPSSNTCLKSGLCDVRRLKAANIKVGLGTDVAGGNSVSILHVMRSALEVSIHLSFSKSNYEPLNYKDVFYLATLGGAEALDMSNKIGNFEPGKEFDALVINLDAPNSTLDNLKDYSLDEKLQRFIYSGDDRNIVQVYVSGKHVA